MAVDNGNFVNISCTKVVNRMLKAKAVPLHAMKALGGEEV
jgi:hypothetical protein